MLIEHLLKCSHRVCTNNGVDDASTINS